MADSWGRYRSQPIVVEAVHWEGGDHAILTRFCGQNWTRADVHDMGQHDDEGVIVYNSLSDTWLPVFVGDWIIRGTRGELYPCNDDVFNECYRHAVTGRVPRDQLEVASAIRLETDVDSCE